MKATLGECFWSSTLHERAWVCLAWKPWRAPKGYHWAVRKARGEDVGAAPVPAKRKRRAKSKRAPARRKKAA